jgi:hypothetical protein
MAKSDPSKNPQEDPTQPQNEAGQPTPSLAPKALEQLEARGVTEPEHHTAVHEAVQRGVPMTKILGWVGEFGPRAIDLVKEILDAVGKKDDGTSPTKG